MLSLLLSPCHAITMFELLILIYSTNLFHKDFIMHVNTCSETIFISRMVDSVWTLQASCTERPSNCFPLNVITSSFSYCAAAIPQYSGKFLRDIPTTVASSSVAYLVIFSRDQWAVTSAEICSKWSYLRPPVMNEAFVPPKTENITKRAMNKMAFLFAYNMKGNSRWWWDKSLAERLLLYESLFCSNKKRNAITVVDIVIAITTISHRCLRPICFNHSIWFKLSYEIRQQIKSEAICNA